MRGRARSCEATSTPEACAESLAALEPRLVRAELQARARSGRGGPFASVRGRVEAELVDRASATVAFRDVRDRVSLLRPYTRARAR